MLLLRKNDTDADPLESLRKIDRQLEKQFPNIAINDDWADKQFINILREAEFQKHYDDGPNKAPGLMRAGGGPRKTTKLQKQALEGLTSSISALCDWDEWRCNPTSTLLDNEVNNLVGGAKAPRTIKTYVSCFIHWAHFRELQEKPVLVTENEGLIHAERDVLRFAALQFGPLGKAAATVDLYLRAMGYARKLQLGYNPLEQMTRVRLLLDGAQRINGPPVRKLPISCEALVAVRRALRTEDISANIMFCTISLGWFPCSAGVNT